MSILKVKNLSKIYGEKDIKTVAVDNVSFEVEKGEFVAIVGTSGSGKSTLLHMIGGVDKPTSGEVEINGVNIYELNEAKLAEFRRKQVALIYQFYNLIPVLNVEENMTLPIKLDGRNPDEQKLNELISKLGLKERKYNLPNELSRRTTTKSSNWKKYNARTNNITCR
jgi:putative ABC transport system ATP-binding protein